MAVEKMVMMNLVGALQDEDEILKQIVLMGNVHLEKSLDNIYESHFTFHNLEGSLNEMAKNQYNGVKGLNNEDCSELINRIQHIAEALNIKPKMNTKYLDDGFEYGWCQNTINKIYDEVHPIHKTIQEKEEIIKKYQSFKKNIKYILNQDINFDELRGLHFFRYKIGTMSHENRRKIAKNYENITAIAKAIGTGEDWEVFLFLYPQKVEEETERLLKSVNFEEITIPEGLSGTPLDMNKQMERIIKDEQSQINELLKEISKMKNNYKDLINRTITKLRMRQKVNKVKESIETGSNVFILSGWVPERQKENIIKQLSMVSEKFVTEFKDTNEIKKTFMPPTQLRNPKWFQPFENLVKMYGVPNYNELDPTIFLAITYLIMFGAMFGDVGQGLIFIIAGVILEKKNIGGFFGPIVMKLGISSIVFGFLYGSIFGNEEVIPGIVKNIFGLPNLIINPMENMNLMLISAVGFGIILILFAFVYSILNARRENNMKEGLFGRNGLAGLIFYLSLLLVIYDFAMNSPFISKGILFLFMILTMVLMVIREPLANRIQHKFPLYGEEISSYYVESGFDIVETILSLTSNTISFIRVGAFALNHVGLFLAFKTMADMANGGGAGVLIMIVGNIIIIGLEGLIVFIQGLRLQYYELFGKYFRGEGIEFRPIQFMN